ncbi:MAG: HD domain-containing protein [Sedimentisphaerales bacterium]|nr:HD domain-containing protein [Sedimentisphaerales bacterium]
MASDRINIADMQPNQLIEQVFMISQPQLRPTRNGTSMYIAAYLSDKTGRLNGRMWQATETLFKALPEEGFVWVKGRSEMYQDSLQLVIEAIKPIEIDKINPADFMPTTDKNIEAMFAQVVTILGTVKNEHLARLMQAFLTDKELMTKFKSAPAAKLLHHAYVGGLLEHTLSVLQLAQRVLPQYPQLDADLVMAGVFLHDIGKTTELRYDISFDYSDEGHLIGHLVKGALLVEDKVNDLNRAGGEPFPPLLLLCLQHLIVAHHGTREFGCPVTPSMPEAFLVHYLDNIDSKVALTFSEIDKDNKTTTRWTTYVKALEAPVFKLRPEEID